VLGSKAAAGIAAPAPIHLVQGGIRPGGAGTRVPICTKRARGGGAEGWGGSSRGCGGGVAATAIDCLPGRVGGWVERESGRGGVL
jgi:hypothetical protein